MRRWLFIICLFLISGCTHQVSVPVSPAHSVYSDYEEQIPGKWRAFVYSDTLSQEVRSCCDTYPLNANTAFKNSTKDTLNKLFEELEYNEESMSPETMMEKSLNNVISVISKKLSASIENNPRGTFWGTYNDYVAKVELYATITIRGQNGRLLEFTANGDGLGKNSVKADMTGSGGASALSEATSKAMVELMDGIAGKIQESRPYDK